MLERLTRLRISDWVAPLALTALLIALYLAGPACTMALRYERTRILGGEWWRLLGGHLVHADAAHLLWNVLGLLLVAWLFAHEYRWRDWLLILLASTAAVDAGFLILQPELVWYLGFSGVLHGLMGAGLVAWLFAARDRLTALVALLFAAKLAWEHFAGPLPFTAATLTLPVIAQAHTYGAAGGIAAALLLQEWRRRHRPAPL